MCLIDIANKYESELHDLFFDTWYDEKYKFYHNGYYSSAYVAQDTNFEKHEFVSLNNSRKVLGYIGYDIDTARSCVDNLELINFSNDKFTYGKDVYQALTNIFEKFNFRKISFCVVVGNPTERTYDRWCAKYGGRVVGIKKNEVKLMDNRYYDLKLYEILLDDYIFRITKRARILS